jgi:hypothetical protein
MQPLVWISLFFPVYNHCDNLFNKHETIIPLAIGYGLEIFTRKLYKSSFDYKD